MAETQSGAAAAARVRRPWHGMPVTRPRVSLPGRASPLPRRVAVWAVAAAVAVACTEGEPAAGNRLAADRPPEEIFADLERRLLDAGSVRIRYEATSEGAFPASLRGTLLMTLSSVVDLQATGTFGDAPVTLHLLSDGRTLEGGSGERTFQGEVPPELDEALILGLTRMGILHNLARLTAAAAPDHAGGGVREWVEVRDVAVDAAALAREPELLPLRFAIHVSGERTAEATLWLDRGTGLPLRREQVVEFPGGRMDVVETYEFVAGSP